MFPIFATATIVKTVRTTSGKRTGMTLDNISENYQEVQRPLLTVDECMTLPGMKKDNAGNVNEAGDMLIFIVGNSALYGKQILYFRDPEFLKRAKIRAPIKSDLLITAEESESNEKKQQADQQYKKEKTDAGLAQPKRKNQIVQSRRV